MVILCLFVLLLSLWAENYICVCVGRCGYISVVVNIKYLLVSCSLLFSYINASSFQPFSNYVL